MKIVKFIIAYAEQSGEKGLSPRIHFDWNRGMMYACYGGSSRNYMKIVKFIIEKGANGWNQGMLYACYGENVKMVKFFIDKGAAKWTLEEKQNEELVVSLSFLELKKYMKLKIVPVDVKKMIQNRLCLLSQIYIYMFWYSNMFPVLIVF